MIGGAKGIGIGLDFGIGNIKRPTKRDYLDPSVKEALCGVWIADQNTNDSPTRNIIKNKLPNRGGDFEILNAAYKLNSGYGKYEVDFTEGYLYNAYAVKEVTNKYFSFDVDTSMALLYKSIKVGESNNQPSYKIKMSNLKGNLRYNYINNDGNKTYVLLTSNGEHILPTSYDSLITMDNWVGFSSSGACSATITQIPSYQGAFCTDGVDDLIVSQKKSLEIIGDNQPYTVISMLKYNGGANTYFNNAIGVTNMNKNTISADSNNKLSILGYSAPSVGAGDVTIINNILGDKKDYGVSTEIATTLVDRNFSVQGYLRDSVVRNVAQVAWYWTFIAKRVLTTDEINQVIAYYNLDKYVTPDVYYDVKKQGITNENHAEFGDKLIDYSGNGKDMQLYNLGWEGMSGANGYPVVFGANKTWEEIGIRNFIVNTESNKLHITKIVRANYGLLISYLKQGGVLKNIKEIPSFRIKVSGLEGDSLIRYRYLKTDNAIKETIIYVGNGIHELPKSFVPTNTLEDNVYVGFTITPIQEGVLEFDCNITIEVLPEYENAIVLDGVEDYGQYVGDLGLKDYTVVADRAYHKFLNSGIPIASTISKNVNTPFLFEFAITNSARPYSFMATTILPALDLNRKLSYQSTYIYNKTEIDKGDSKKTGDGLTFGRFGIEIQYAALCLYSFMLFPYTLSEFLIERQLKKRKLGTLYSNMVEWRPVNNADMNLIYEITYKLNDSKVVSVGEYIPINSGVSIRINLIKYQLDEVSLLKVNGQAIQMRKLGDYWKGDFTVTKSPQKIDITIDEYIRYEDISQPYPALLSFYETENPDKVLTWGSKLKVGSTIKVKSITHTLVNLYNIKKYVYNDERLSYVELMSKEFVVKNNLSFRTDVNYMLNNEPKCILSPERLSIPNSSYKILGYIPDISGHGNHGKLNNSAYEEGSGVNADGSYGLDGVDDFISIPTLSTGGKQLLMKVNWRNIDTIVYDQRNSSVSNYKFAIYTVVNSIAYAERNDSKTFIDGILNTSILSGELQSITHNISIINDSVSSDNSKSPILGSNVAHNSYFSNMSLYTFMLFDEISTEEEIKELNEIVGIEGNTNNLFNPTN